MGRKRKDIDLEKVENMASFACTQEEIESVSRMVQENLELHGTIEDIARFYDVPESKVRNTINRKMVEKPKRRVYYRFLSFMKIVPEKWRKS